MKKEVAIIAVNFDLVIFNSLIIKKVAMIAKIPDMAERSLVEKTDRSKIAIKGTLRYIYKGGV